MASAFPIGTFTNSVGWTYDFKNDGRYIFQQADVHSGVGTYSITGKQVAFSESTSTYAEGNCVGDAKEGVYTWTFDGKALSFKVLDDRCGSREGLLTSGPWLKKP